MRKASESPFPARLSGTTRGNVSIHQKLLRSKSKTSMKRKTFFGLYAGRSSQGAKIATDLVVRKLMPKTKTLDAVPEPSEEERKKGGRPRGRGRTFKTSPFPGAIPAKVRKDIEKKARKELCMAHGPSHLRFLRSVFLDSMKAEDRRQKLLRSCSPKQRVRLRKVFASDRKREQQLLRRIRKDICEYVDPKGRLFAKKIEQRRPHTAGAADRRERSGRKDKPRTAIPAIAKSIRRPSSAGTGRPKIGKTSTKRGTFFGTYLCEPAVSWLLQSGDRRTPDALEGKGRK